MIFFFNDTATTEIYTLSLHDALPIFVAGLGDRVEHLAELLGRDRQGLLDEHGLARPERLGDHGGVGVVARDHEEDRKSTRLNSSHANISYAVFCLKKKKTTEIGMTHL